MLDNPVNIYIVACLVPAVLYWLVYGLGSPWYRSALGVVMFLFATSMALVFGLVAWAVFIGPAPEPVRTAVYLTIALALWAKLIILLVERRAPRTSPTNATRKEPPMPDLTEGGAHVAIRTDTVPPIWFAAKRVVRTIVQSLVVYVPLVNIVAVIVVDFLTKQTDFAAPSWLFVALNGIVVATAALMGLVAKLMAHPTVNAWLVKIGLGSVPASAIRDGKV